MTTRPHTVRTVETDDLADFRDVGPVELKGVTGASCLHAASRPA